MGRKVRLIFIDFSVDRSHFGDATVVGFLIFSSFNFFFGKTGFDDSYQPEIARKGGDRK